jgi:hypothetical protein
VKMWLGTTAPTPPVGRRRCERPPHSPHHESDRRVDLFHLTRPLASNDPQMCDQVRCYLCDPVECVPSSVGAGEGEDALDMSASMERRSSNTRTAGDCGGLLLSAAGNRSTDNKTRETTRFLAIWPYKAFPKLCQALAEPRPVPQKASQQP